MGISQRLVNGLAFGQDQIQFGVHNFFRNGVVAEDTVGRDLASRFAPLDASFLTAQKFDGLVKECAGLCFREGWKSVELLKSHLLLSLVQGQMLDQIPGQLFVGKFFGDCIKGAAPRCGQPLWQGTAAPFPGGVRCQPVLQVPPNQTPII